MDLFFIGKKGFFTQYFLTVLGCIFSNGDIIFCFVFLLFYFCLNFISFIFLKKTRQQTKTKLVGEVDPYLEGIEAKFQQDPLRGFGEMDILPHYY